MSSVEKPSNPRAVVALVLGVVGVLGALTLASMGAVIGSLAVVFGFVARREPERQGMATAGIVLGMIAVVVGVVSTVLTATGAWPV